MVIECLARNAAAAAAESVGVKAIWTGGGKAGIVSDEVTDVDG